MGVIILLPAVLCWLQLAWGSARKALLNVYLPCLLLLPDYYLVRLKHLPALCASDCAVLPLGVALLATQMRRWRLAWMDLWVFLFALAVVLSQGLGTEMASGDWIDFFSEGLTTSHRLSTNFADSIMMFFANILHILLPYMIGKLLIEQPDENGENLRRPLVKRVALLLASIGIFSIVDFFTGHNTWQKIGSKLFPDKNVEWPEMIRWGFGRIAGPYGHAILAGMIFLVGLIYCAWLLQVDSSWGKRRLIQGLPLTARQMIPAGILLGLVMTQSRGPWLGVILALAFILLNRVLSVGKAAVVFLLFVVVVGWLGVVFGKNYTAGQWETSQNEEQRSAIYRRMLLTNYAPLVAERPTFGWGITNFPEVMGQRSIDNQYLLLAVTEGLFGLGTYLLVALGSVGRLLRMVAQPLKPEDRLLVFAHISVYIGLLVTLATVYMGEQVVMIFFLITGWVQSMNPGQAETSESSTDTTGFRHVLA